VVAVRLIATDIDGTLLRADGSISPRSRSALHAAVAAGIDVVLVTGRPPRWMAPIADATGLAGTAVCANGAVAYDLGAEAILAEYPLTPAQAQLVVAALRTAEPDVVFAVEWAANAGFAREPAWEPGPRGGAGATMGDLDELVSRPIIKILARLDGTDPDLLLATAQSVVGALATPTHSSIAGLVELSAPGVSKASGLARLSEARGIPAEAVMAFGDMPNDLPMLMWAGQAVAVANAHPDVLAAGGRVTASNDDDGVARVIEEMLRR
jgi:Cof subfamily protein (haloacid dehalogenase superfamily)